MNKRRYDDPAFGTPRHANQDAIDRFIEEDYGPDSVPQRTSQPPPSSVRPEVLRQFDPDPFPSPGT